MHARSILSASLILSMVGTLSGLVGCESARLGTPGAVAGRYIITVGDADMTASAFTTGELGERDPSAQDMLTVVSLPIREPVTAFSQVNVSNSALCPPTCLSVTRDGNYAFVVDYRGPAGPDARTILDLPKGDTVTAIDLTDPLRPFVSAKIQVPAEPIAVAAHPAGEMVAVVTHTPGSQIVLVPFKSGSFTGEPAAWPVLGTDTAGADDAKPTSIAWHPGGRALAVTLRDRGEVVFYRFRRTDAGAYELAPWAQPVKAGRAPYTGAFTPDGRHFIVSDLQWSQGQDAYTAGTPQGTLISIRVGDMPAGLDSADGGAAGHVVVGEAPVGVNPIALAISSDGKLVVAANMQHSAVLDTSIAPPAGGSISLLTVNADGTLAPAGEYALSALPAGISFDAKDNHVCVTQFRSFDPEAIDGELGFWSVQRKNGVRLEAADFFVGVGKGPHGVLIVR